MGSEYHGGELARGSFRSLSLVIDLKWLLRSKGTSNDLRSQGQ